MTPAMSHRAALPPREAFLHLRVERVFEGDKWGRTRGIAHVESSVHPLGELGGQSVLFSINDAVSLDKGARFYAKGLVVRRALYSEAGSFDEWLERSGVHFNFSRAVLLEEVQAPPRWMGRMNGLREYLSQSLAAGSDAMPQIRAMLPAMFLGQRRLLDAGDGELFRTTGMMHLFAVSGLHVGLVALTVEAILAFLRMGTRWRVGGGLLILLAYVLLIGAPPSAVRAFIMLLFHRAGLLWGRPTRGLPALSASALAVLIWNPAQLFDIGARLSYGIVAGILFYGVPLGRMLNQRLALYEDLPAGSLSRGRRALLWTKGWFCTGAASCAGAFLIGAPLSVQYFGVFAPGSLLLNLLLVPVALLCVAAASLSAMFYLAALLPVCGALAAIGEFFSRAGWVCALFMHEAIDALARVPFLFARCRFPVEWMGSALALGLLVWVLVLNGSWLRMRLRLWFMPLAFLFAVAGLCAAFTTAS